MLEWNSVKIVFTSKNGISSLVDTTALHIYKKNWKTNINTPKMASFTLSSILRFPDYAGQTCIFWVNYKQTKIIAFSSFSTFDSRQAHAHSHSSKSRVEV